MGKILALDQGTTSSRALVFDERGRVLASAQKEFTQFFPQSGWVEHDAEEIWSTQYAVANEALAQAGLKPSEIAAIGITNQRETTVIWDRNTSKPISKAIVWQDRRTTPICESLKASEPFFQQKTGLLLDPYFSGTKIRWLLDAIPGSEERAAKGELLFGTIDSWLAWKLSGGALHIIDVSNASRTLLCNLQTADWDPELLERLHIPRQMLPKVVASSEVYGATGAHVFSSQIPIGALIGDQQAALYGEGCWNAGQAKITYGTGAFLLYNTGKICVPSKKKLLTTIAWKIGSEVTYALEGSLFIAGAAIQWFRDQLGLIEKSAEIDALAGTVPDSGGVYFVPAFAGLGAPHWDPRARGTILGITRGTTGAHLARATLESIAYGVADILETMNEEVGKSAIELKVDGGASASDLLMQVQADLLQASLLRPKNRELTAWGAALLAAKAVGIEIEAHLELDKVFQPQISPELAKSRRAKWTDAVERAKEWA